MVADTRDQTLNRFERMEEDAPSNFKSNNKTLAVERAEVATVLELGSFERFVYVMSVLEHYSDQDCSVLLGCTLWDVIAARIRTLQQIEVRRNFTVSGKCRLREGRTA